MIKFSVLANIVLAALVFYLAQRSWHAKDQSSGGNAMPPASEERDGAVTESQAVREPAGFETKPFQWRQIESTNYRTYVANLRGIGCPEQTIRDIITADVHNLYAPQRRELEQKKTSLAAGFTKAPVLELELQRLRTEEDSVVATLLGEQALTEVAANGSGAPRRRVSPRETSVSMPLVFQNVDPELKLDHGQLEVIDDLRQRFRREIGEANPDPNDPAYRDRWTKAQRNADDLLAGMLGGQFFVEFQMRVGQAPP